MIRKSLFSVLSSSDPGLCPVLCLLWQLLDRNCCPELWGAVSSLRAELKPCFHCSVRLVLRDYRHHPHLQVSIYRHWRHSPSVNCVLQWVGEHGNGAGASIPFRAEALAQKQPAMCLQCAPASPSEEQGTEKKVCLLSGCSWADFSPGQLDFNLTRG